MQRLTFSFNIANIQSSYATNVICGNITLPLTKQEMELDIQLWKQKEIKVKNILDYIYFTKDYVKDLIKITNYPPFNIDQMVQILIDCFKSKLDNIITYRDKTYTSTITNTMAKQHHTPWLQEMDDTLLNFINK